MNQRLAAIATILVLVAPSCTPVASDPMPSWQDAKAKNAIIDFVSAVADADSEDFVPAAERIATFDNDGTLWAEQPMYFQLAFAVDRVRALAPQHPEWTTEEPFASLLSYDLEAALAGGEKAILEIVMATHSGMTTEAFDTLVREWIATAKHPLTGMHYSEMTYQPMVELLDFLRANGFKTWIVSGGGVDFLRAWAEVAYGIPPEQVIGSSGASQFEMQGDTAVIVKLPQLDFIDDKEGKPVAINKYIGRRPIAAFGNSDGDLQMLQYAAAGAGRRLAAIVHHDDAEREYAYDRQSHIGRLDQALDEAEARGWTVISMKHDWNTIYTKQ
jgi:phosphoglycolate phosphatase-like HAD superfamily hydrolase